MRILYINDELATADGSNYHANGILSCLQELLGAENVRSFPQAIDGSQVHTDHASISRNQKHKKLLQFIRLFRKKAMSHVRSRRIIKDFKKSGWTPTHVLGRTVMFDNTPLLVAKHFGAKLICEVNTPMYYEHCIMNKLPLQKSVERWEKKILQKSDYIYVVSAVCRDMLCNHYNLDAANFLVIPNGYDDSLYPENSAMYTDKRNTIRQNEHLEDKFIITFIGSLKPWHGINSLCRIADVMKEHTDIHFIVAGDGSERAQVETYCSTHSNMTYKGKLPLTEMSYYLAASDLGIMPYAFMDNFYFSPLKMFDMIGAALPFIGTNQGQIHDICTEFLTDTFLIDRLDDSALSEQILNIVKNPSVYEDMKTVLKQACPDMTWKKRTETLIRKIR